MGRLTESQVVRGNREAMMGDDGVGVALQQLICVGFVKLFVTQFSGHVDIRGDSESTKSRVCYRLGDT